MERHSKRVFEATASLGCATGNASAENLKGCTQSPKHIKLLGLLTASWTGGSANPTFIPNPPGLM